MQCVRYLFFLLTLFPIRASAQPEPGASSSPKAQTLTVQSATSFLQDCLQKWAAKDPSLWMHIVDEALFPTGFWSQALTQQGFTGATKWTKAFGQLPNWYTPARAENLPKTVQVVWEIRPGALKDYRGLQLKTLFADAPPPSKIPIARVRSLALGVDFNGDSVIEPEETTRVHELDGGLLWEPFGW